MSACSHVSASTCAHCFGGVVNAQHAAHCVGSKLSALASAAVERCPVAFQAIVIILIITGLPTHARYPFGVF